MHTADFLVFLAYFVLVSGYGLWIYQRKKDGPASADEFFLAEGSLTWWAIGSSIIGSGASSSEDTGTSDGGSM